MQNVVGKMPNYSKREQIAPKQLPKWTNSDNKRFYEKVPLEIIQKFAIETGLTNCCDINLIMPYVLNSNSLLEVGGGYGRVLKHVLQQGYNQKLYALERCKKFLQILRQNFHNQIELFDTNLYDFKSEINFDLILWMWGGIANFSKDEQNFILQKISSTLNPNGLIIIDALETTTKPIHIVKEWEQNYVIEASNEILHAYCPSSTEINNYANSNNLCLFRKINYKTETNMNRVIYILKNNTH